VPGGDRRISTPCDPKITRGFVFAPGEWAEPIIAIFHLNPPKVISPLRGISPFNTIFISVNTFLILF